MTLPHSLLPGLLTLLLAVSAPAATPRDDPAAVAFFEKKVRPILVGHCYACHSAETKPAGGLRVDDRNGLLQGGNTGPAVVPGKPGESLLIRRVTQGNGKRRMPLEGKHLSEPQVQVLKKWIADGAAWPAVRLPFSFGQPRPSYDRLRKTHWAWQVLTDPPTPAVRDRAWPRDPIDCFLLARLEEKGLRPVADSPRGELLRRVTFDLTGLPPTPDALTAFLADDAPDAYERLVDRLLASPAFGERWGRHWLDVARYGESTGPSRNIPYPHAWRYRDHVLDAVNADVPFDRFVTEQLAGDLLPAHDPQERDRLLTATGFLALGVKDVNQRFKVRFLMDNVDEQIDVVTRAVLGLTVSCARCHDHKFDPIPTTDYYALAGIFTSTDNCAGVRNQMGGSGLAYYVPDLLLRLSTSRPPPPAEQVRKLQQQVARARAEWEAIRGTPEGLARGPNGQPRQRPIRQRYERLQAELRNLTDPAARQHTVHGVRDARTLGDTEVRIRGEAEKLGPLVPRGFLTVFSVPGAPAIHPRQSGRLELARWLMSSENPLTPRVIVNRVWARLFHQGIVSTVDNFGITGDRPTHPELLDHLARRFLHDGWSIKQLVRTLVRTHAYRLGTDAPAGHRAIDPGNRLVWRHTPRRLDAEELRDAMLASAGRLRLDRGEGSAAASLRMVEMRDDGPEARTIHEQANRSRHRSVYLPLLRGVTPQALEAFDPVEQTLVTGQRDATTVPAQALYLLNSTFVRQQALALAQGLLGDDGSDTDRIRQAYLLTLGRPPSGGEVERVREFLAGYESDHARAESGKSVPSRDARTAAWTAFVQALYGSVEFRYLN